MSFVELDLIDRDQWQTQIAHFFEQTMQGRLISYKSRKKRVANVFQRDGQVLKPVSPMGIQVALKANFVLLSGRSRFVNHLLAHG
ncbi:MAG: hypothetical protein QY332_15705 [Anaerolineales bacterium]|nr:MAG: hypothetical protein QY332_15705 [Anaerolineales bacterium]